MYQFDFSYNEYQMLLQRCPFTDEEKRILELRRKGESNTKICMDLCIGSTTLNKKLHKICKKIAKEL